MNRVKELCDRRGIVQKQLALAVGVSQPTVSDWFRNKTDPSGARLEKLSEVLGVSRAVILGYDADPEAPQSLRQLHVEKLFDNTVGGLSVGFAGILSRGKTNFAPGKQETINNIMAKLEQLDDDDRKTAEDHIDFLLSRRKGDNK